MTKYDGMRAMEPKELAGRVKQYTSARITVEQDSEKAMEAGLRSVKPDDVLLFTGSLYLIGEIRSFF